jgi:hypothetical protein
VTSANANGGVLQLNGGITFPATQVAASNGNTLDDYEEGAFTPTLSFGGNSVGITYTSQKGQYIKIGRNVFINFYMFLANKGSSTGAAGITGFPFGTGTNGGLPIDFFIPLGVRGNLNSGGDQVSLYSGAAGTTTFLLYKTNLTGGANGALLDTAFANNTELNFNFWYQTD